MLLDMRANLGHGIADSLVVGKDMGVLASVPFKEAWQFGGNGTEKANNDTERNAFHLVTKLRNGTLVGYAVVLVKLHHLPDGENESGQHKDGWPVLELVAAVDG